MSELNDDIVKRIRRIFLEDKKKEISGKYTAQFFYEGNNELPLDIEEAWVNNIEEFEIQFQNSKSISLWEYIGCPNVHIFDEQRPIDIDGECKQIIQLLVDNNIEVEFPDHIDILAKYRFITEELIKEEIEDIRIPGFQLHFDYEQYHGSELNN